MGGIWLDGLYKRACLSCGFSGGQDIDWVMMRSVGIVEGRVGGWKVHAFCGDQRHCKRLIARFRCCFPRLSSRAPVVECSLVNR